MTRKEIESRLNESRAKIDEIIDEFTVLMAERMQEGITGRVTVEIITDCGFVSKRRITQENNFGEKPHRLLDD